MIEKAFRVFSFIVVDCLPRITLQFHLRYSYDFGLVHFIMMSTEHNFEPNSRQYRWLENDLKKIDRKKTPWVIFGGHRAMYASQDEHGEELSLTEDIPYALLH